MWWKREQIVFPCLFLFLSPFLFPVAPPYVKVPPSALPPFSFFSLSVPLFLCFVLSLSPPLPSPCAVVCRHAGISGPQNDRPNLSALAPVTKDGRPGSVCACDWCASELLSVWLVATCLSTSLVFLAKVWIQFFCLCKAQFSSVICDCLVTITLPLLCFLSCTVLATETYCMCYCKLLCLCLLVCVWMRGVLPRDEDSGSKLVLQLRVFIFDLSADYFCV